MYCSPKSVPFPLLGHSSTSARPLVYYYTSDTICEKAILQTGARPLIKPSAEPHTLILNGRTDNRHYKQEKTAQYTAVDAIELVNQNGSCPIPIPDLKQRIGPVAGFVDDHVIICGGFSMEEPLVKHFPPIFVW